jgi:hypothetical protein
VDHHGDHPPITPTACGHTDRRRPRLPPTGHANQPCLPTIILILVNVD